MTISTTFNRPLFALTLAAIAALFALGFAAADIDADITGYLPRRTPVIADAAYIFKNHPIQDQLVVDVGLDREDPDALAAIGDRVETRLRESGLFDAVGMTEFRETIPALVPYVVDHLPVLFTRHELETRVAPRLAPGAAAERLRTLRRGLMGLEGIGQARFAAVDPLGLKDLVLARLIHLAPTSDVRIHKGKLLSQDGRHLLVMAHPKTAGTDTDFARTLDRFFQDLSADLVPEYAAQGDALTLTPVGAYRAALDNEVIARRDVTRAIVPATAGIALLLLFAFPRPYIGLLAFLPAAAGAAAAFFILSLIHRSVSLMALGFGGAVISITVDHGIAYLLFLDRPRATTGAEASHEIRAVGLITALTTMGAFGALSFTDFPIFAQLGQFAALGIGFAFLFVHSVFPRIFPEMPAAKPRRLPLRGLVDRLSGFGRKGAWTALGVGLFLLVFARPDFNVDMSAMNTVTSQTQAAESLVTSTWGDAIFEKIHLMTQGDAPPDLQAAWDRLRLSMERDMAADILESGFVPSMLFPGDALRRKNGAAWRAFWTPERTAGLKLILTETGAELGFTADAFAPFLEKIGPRAPIPDDAAIPPAFFDLLGLKRTADGDRWTQFSSLTPGDRYDAERFFHRYRGPDARVFDPAYFTRSLGELLAATFVKMLLIVSAGVFLLLTLFFFDIRLAAAALTPVVFAFVCTLGILNLAGRSLDIPGLMLGIIVFGMGIDYSLFTVRARQRYRNPDHPNQRLIRMTVFMAAASTLIGFGALLFAKHALLKSAGLTSFLGIGFSVIGAFVILPPLLDKIFSSEKPGKKPAHWRDRVQRRYRNLEGFPRIFARFKLRLDPMFTELPELLKSVPSIRTALDIGCGYGVPACALAEWRTGIRVFGMDPDPERVRVAAAALDGDGDAVAGGAPEIDGPGFPDRFDLVLILDVIHYLPDAAFDLTLKRVYGKLKGDGRLVIRAVIPPSDNGSRLWRLDTIKRRITGASAWHRPADRIREMASAAGFQIEDLGMSGGNPEAVWFMARPGREDETHRDDAEI